MQQGTSRVTNLRFSVVDVLSDPGHKVNEDVVGATTRLIWALDGASARIDYSRFESTAASRLVTSLSQGLRDLADTAESDAKPVLRAAIAHAAMEVSATGSSTLEDPPSCAAGLALLSGNEVRICVVGDISIVAQSDREVKHYTDPIAEDRERKISKSLIALSAISGRIEDAREKVWTDVQRERAEMQFKRGLHGFVSLDPSSARYATTYSIRVKPGDHFLLSTDGFARVVHLFGVTNWYTVMSDLKAANGDLRSLIHRVRMEERNDSSCVRFPRMSTSDDASAIYVRVDDEDSDGRS